MITCPICNLSLDSHSTSELTECCLKQLGKESPTEESQNLCPTCKHEISQHTKNELAECTIEYLKSAEFE